MMPAIQRVLKTAAAFAIATQLFVEIAFAQVDKEPQKADPIEAHELESMIEALANTKNRAPKIIRRGPFGYPLFDGEYDVEEQRRVRKALVELNRHVGDELWPLLVKYNDDKRYALTFDADSHRYNQTIGELCRRMAHDDLLLPLTRAMPKEDRGNDYHRYLKSDWKPSKNRDSFEEEDLEEWLRKGKSLHELQIEICELAIEAAPTMKKLSEKEREKFVKDLTDQIKEIKTTGKPIVNPTRFRGEYYAICSEKSVRGHQERLKVENEKKPDPKDDPRKDGVEFQKPTPTAKKPNTSEKK